MGLEGESIVKINVRNHDISIKDELEIFIKHRRNCKKPCCDTEAIVTYLQDEMFLAEGFFVTSNQDY